MLTLEMSDVDVRALVRALTRAVDSIDSAPYDGERQALRNHFVSIRERIELTLDRSKKRGG